MRSSSVFLRFLLLICYLVGASVTFAGSNANLVYSGRILRPDGSTINTGAMTFTLNIKDASNNCTLWKETHTISMADSLGTFALTVGAGTRTDGGTHTFKQTLINAGTLTGLTCASGTTYSPGSSDDRNLSVSFDDAGTVVNLAAVAIKSVPFAMQADQVSGYGIMNLAKISGLGTATTITGAQFDFLANLAAPASATATPCANNDTLKFVGGVWTCAAAGGAGAASTSTLTSATGTNSTDNANFTQTWDWSTLSNQTGLSLTSSSNALVNGGTILNVANTGSSTNGTVARIQSNTTAGSGLTVLANGNVGIGTAVPSSQFSNNNLNTLDSVASGSYGAAATAINWNANSGGYVQTLYNAHTGSGIPSAGLLVKSAQNGTNPILSVDYGATQAGAGTTLFRVQGNGNVGIGTVSPAERLEVNGAIKLGTTVGTNAGSIRWDGTNFSGYTGTAWVNFVPNPPASGACGTTVTYNSSGTYSYTVPASFGTITVKAWGAGGSGGAGTSANSNLNGLNGGASTVSSLGLSAGGGVGGGSSQSAASSGGSGGIASGGDVNTNGNAAAGTALPGSSAGANAPNGGTGGGVAASFASASAGGTPGAGGAGAYGGVAGTGAGGGSGAYVEKTYTPATLVPGTTISDIVVGAGGAARNVNPYYSGAGGSGQVSIVCSNTGAPAANDRAIIFMNGTTYSNSTNFVYDSSGQVGIGTASPQATLDVNGQVRLAKNAAQPVACSATNDGAIALTSAYTLCVCKGGTSSWVRTTDGSTACTW